MTLDTFELVNPGADSGFPVVGKWTPFWKGVDLRCGGFSVKMYVKMKELGSVGGGGVRRKILYVDPPMEPYCLLTLEQSVFESTTVDIPKINA